MSKPKHVFDVLMYSKITVFFLKFKKGAHELRVNETKPDTENASNWDHFGFGVDKQ